MLVKGCLEMDWTCAQCTKPDDAVRTSGEHSPLCHDELVDLTAPPTVDDIQPVPEPSPPPIPDRKRRLLDRRRIYVNLPPYSSTNPLEEAATPTPDQIEHRPTDSTPLHPAPSVIPTSTPRTPPVACFNISLASTGLTSAGDASEVGLLVYL